MTDQELEQKLIPYANKARLCTIMMPIMLLCMIFGVMGGATGLLSKGLIALVVLGSLVILIICNNASHNAKAAYNRLFSEQRGAEMVKIIDEFFGPQLDKRMTDGFTAEINECIEETRNLVRASGLYSDYENCDMNSYRKGCYNGHVFTGFNAHLTKMVQHEEFDSEGVLYTTNELSTVFNGRCLVMELNRTTDEITRTALMKLFESEKAETQFALVDSRLLVMQKDLKFLDIQGKGGKHIEDFRDNLKKSMAETGAFIDRIAGTLMI